MQTNNSDQKFIFRKCPSCGSNFMHPEISSKFNAENYELSELSKCWNGFFKEKIIFNYARCKTCGLLFAPKYFSDAQLAYLYSAMPANMDIVPESAIKKTQSGYFEVLARNSSLKGGVIEVGPDVGWFIDCCVKNGNFNKYWLLEPNIHVKDILKSKVQSIEHYLINDMFGFEDIPNGAASVLVMIHVLDHLIDPVKFMNSIRSKLEPNGVVLIVTHNERSFLSRILKEKWPAYCLQHPQIYNKSTITTLLEKSGFNVAEIIPAKNYFEIGFLLKHIFWAIFKIKITPPKFLNREIGLKLGNIITVARVK